MRTNKNGVNKDQKDKVKKDGYNRGQHCVYCLTYHMIFVTHYRKPVKKAELSPPTLFLLFLRAQFFQLKGLFLREQVQIGRASCRERV